MTSPAITFAEPGRVNPGLCFFSAQGILGPGNTWEQRGKPAHLGTVCQVGVRKSLFLLGL